MEQDANDKKLRQCLRVPGKPLELAGGFLGLNYQGYTRAFAFDERVRRNGTKDAVKTSGFTHDYCGDLTE